MRKGKQMNIFVKGTLLRPAVSLALGIVLLAGVMVHGYASNRTTGAQTLPDIEISALVGGLNSGACGILVGIGLGILIVGSSSVTMGLGGALLVSVAGHVAAYACLS